MANILIGISGSIAAYKSVLYIRELVKQGHNCKVIITPSGLKFVTAELIAGLGVDIYTDNKLDFQNKSQAMLHIELAKWAERVIIAPASANTIAKLAHGASDNLLTEISLAYGNNQIYLAPAMNQQMWLNPRTQANINTLLKYNFTLWNPDSGLQACGDIGQGRMLEPETLLELTNQTFALSILSGKTVIITLGATSEPIDPVRVISNHSSGKMGLALINQLLAAGAEVIAVYGKVDIKLPENINLQKIHAPSSDEMLSTCLEYAKSADIFIGCAAVCDYKVAKYSEQKIKKSVDKISLELTKTTDIISTIKNIYSHIFVVGFAAETENLINNALDKLNKKHLDMIIANDVSQNKIFAQDETEIHIISKSNDIVSLSKMQKHDAAKIIVNEICNFVGKVW